MNGSELRAWRTSRGLYQRDVVAILTAGGVENVDQPTISEWERGIEPIPEGLGDVLEQAPDVPPPTQAPTTPAPARKPRSGRGRRPDPEPEPELERDDEQAGDAGDEQPAPGERDRAPKPVRPPTGAAGLPAVPAWSSEVRNQLERDLRALFAGDTFLVPVPVAQDDGQVVYRHEQAFMPGIAQLVGHADAFDGEVIRMNAPQMARAWAQLADESPRVRGILLALTYGGAWRGVVAATLPVLYSIGVHHGLIPPVLGGAGAAPPPAQVAQHEPAGDGVGAPAT